MRKVIVCLLIAFAVCAATVKADEEGAEKKKEKKQKPALIEIAITGKISKKEKKKGEKTKTLYFIKDAEGKMTRLPTPRGPKKKKGAEEKAVINLDEYIDADVTVTGMGMIKEKNGKKRTFIRRITKIEKSVAAAETEKAE
ncbi:MAG: hypothetical protein ACYTFY_19545 [Planctomycetota bacterium]|jgi:biopolymer transport protein ExbD